MPPAARRSRPARAGREPLDQERILEAAGKIVEADGAKSLTLRQLGAALGVDHTAVLRHFAGKDEILRALADRLLADALTGFAPSPHWRSTLEDIARRVRAAFLDHPSLALIGATRVLRQPAEFRSADIVIQALLDAGLPPHHAALVYRAVVDLALAASALEAQTRLLDEVDRERDAAAWRREYLMAPPTLYPALATVAPDLVEIDDDTVFETAVALVLDSVASRASIADPKQRGRSEKYDFRANR